MIMLWGSNGPLSEISPQKPKTNPLDPCHNLIFRYIASTVPPPRLHVCLPSLLFVVYNIYKCVYLLLLYCILYYKVMGVHILALKYKTQILAGKPPCLSRRPRPLYIGHGAKYRVSLWLYIRNHDGYRRGEVQAASFLFALIHLQA